MIVTNYKNTEKEVAKYKSGKPNDIVYSYTLLQHLNWALTKTGRYIDDVEHVDFSTIGDNETLFMVAHGPKGGKISGNYTGKQLATFLSHKKTGLSAKWKKKEIYVTSCYAAEGGNASVIETLAEELKNQGIAGITVYGYEHTTITHKDVNKGDLLVVTDEKGYETNVDSVLMKKYGKDLGNWVKWMTTNDTKKTLPELGEETARQTKNAYLEAVKIGINKYIKQGSKHIKTAKS